MAAESQEPQTFDLGLLATAVSLTGQDRDTNCEADISACLRNGGNSGSSGNTGNAGTTNSGSGNTGSGNTGNTGTSTTGPTGMPPAHQARPGMAPKTVWDPTIVRRERSRTLLASALRSPAGRPRPLALALEHPLDRPLNLPRRRRPRRRCRRIAARCRVAPTTMDPRL